MRTKQELRVNESLWLWQSGYTRRGFVRVSCSCRNLREAGAGKGGVLCSLAGVPGVGRVRVRHARLDRTDFHRVVAVRCAGDGDRKRKPHLRDAVCGAGESQFGAPGQSRDGRVRARGGRADEGGRRHRRCRIRRQHSAGRYRWHGRRCRERRPIGSQAKSRHRDIATDQTGPAIGTECTEAWSSDVVARGATVKPIARRRHRGRTLRRAIVPFRDRSRILPHARLGYGIRAAAVAVARNAGSGA